MLQMARVMKRYSQFQWTSLGARFQFSQDFANVFALRGKHFGSFRIPRLIPEQMAIFLHVRPASRRIRDNCLDVRAFERLDRPFRQFYRRGFLARVHKQRATTRLFPRRLFVPAGGVTSATVSRGPNLGSSASIARIFFGNSFSSPDPRTTACNPLFW